jgi:hypothetical protein
MRLDACFLTNGVLDEELDAVSPLDVHVPILRWRHNPAVRTADDVPLTDGHTWNEPGASATHADGSGGDEQEEEGVGVSHQLGDRQIN